MLAIYPHIATSFLHLSFLGRTSFLGHKIILTPFPPFVNVLRQFGQGREAYPWLFGKLLNELLTRLLEATTILLKKALRWQNPKILFPELSTEDITDTKSPWFDVDILRVSPTLIQKIGADVLCLLIRCDIESSSENGINKGGASC